MTSLLVSNMDGLHELDTGAQIKLVKASFSDLPYIVDVYNQSIPSGMVTAEFGPISVESREDWFHAHQKPHRPLWLVHYVDNVAGWATLSDFYGRPAYNPTAEISLYLHPQFQGKGIGYRTVLLCEEMATTYGVFTLLSFIFGNNIPSLNLFQKCGYQTWGNLLEIAHMPNGRQDLVILGKHLK